MINKNKYLFILSPRYSGSTLLSFLLATNPEIATIGERRKFYTKTFLGDKRKTSFCSCGKSFEECPHWNKLKKGLIEKINDTSVAANPTEFKFLNNKFLNKLLEKLHFNTTINKASSSILPYNNRLQKMLNFNEELVKEVLALENKTVFLDSSKSIKQLVFLSRIKSFDYRIIFLTRDPRAQVYSYLKYNKASVEQAAQRWMREIEINLAVLEKINLPYINVSYEALCKKPMKQIKRILAFSELDGEGVSLEFRNFDQHIMGNGSMRLGKDKKIVERKEWQTKLKTSEIEKIEKITEAYRGYYGEV